MTQRIGTAGAILAILFLVLWLSPSPKKAVVGFRGGNEAIGGRTGGAAYSGASADLQPDSI